MLSSFSMPFFYCKSGGVRSSVLLCFWSLGIAHVLGVVLGPTFFVRHPNVLLFSRFLLHRCFLRRVLQFTTGLIGAAEP
jgi:hypothetical protein